MKPQQNIKQVRTVRVAFDDPSQYTTFLLSQLQQIVEHEREHRACVMACSCGRIQGIFAGENHRVEYPWNACAPAYIASPSTDLHNYLSI